MHYRKSFENDNVDNSILTDVLRCDQQGEYFRIKYSIYFYKGKFAGETIIIYADLDDIEGSDLASYLIETNYLTEYNNQQDYFEVRNREVFIANWEQQGSFI